MTLIVQPCSYGTCREPASFRRPGPEGERHYCARHAPCGQKGCRASATFRFLWPAALTPAGEARQVAVACDAHAADVQQLASRYNEALELSRLVVVPLCPSCAQPASAVDDAGEFWCSACARAVES
jgi:hypothetical protein